MRTARAAPHPSPLPAANPRATGGERGFGLCELGTTCEKRDAESPLPAGGAGVGGGERVRVRGGSRGPSGGSRVWKYLDPDQTSRPTLTPVVVTSQTFGLENGTKFDTGPVGLSAIRVAGGREGATKQVRVKRADRESRPSP